MVTPRQDHTLVTVRVAVGRSGGRAVGRAGGRAVQGIVEVPSPVKGVKEWAGRPNRGFAG
jgi:hypothetical protein